MKSKIYVQAILKMAKKDRAMRLAHQKKAADWNYSLDRKNTRRMKQIVKAIGWPRISKVGKRAASAAWLLAQHADHDPRFQRQCLTLMKEQPKDDVSRHDIAYLEDRVLLNEGKKQKYGTQFYYPKKWKVMPRPLASRKLLARRRKEMGLESFEENLKTMQQMVDEHRKVMDRKAKKDFS
ncbi:MAG: hypothetical protein PHS79_04320 [Patescibacteria group bacterium]|nr:hypothetical protein [Patescibacteria group bacterium]